MERRKAERSEEERREDVERQRIRNYSIQRGVSVRYSLVGITTTKLSLACVNLKKNMKGDFFRFFTVLVIVCISGFLSSLV